MPNCLEQTASIGRDFGDMSQRQHCAGCSAYILPNTTIELEEEAIYICPDCVSNDNKMKEISRKYGFGEFKSSRELEEVGNG